MKTISRILLVAAIVGAIYFATIGRSQFYHILDSISDVFQTFADNYMKK